jgi:tyrosyl-DNA phosphodiesterase-1
MFLVGYDEWQQNYNHGLRGWQSKVRVVVHTANILKQDIEWKSQGLYDQDFPLKSSTSSQPEKQQAETIKLAGNRGWPFEDEDPQPFEDDLVSYLESYRYSTPQSWCTTGRTLSEVSQSQILSDKSMSLLSLIRKYDFSKAYAVLIPSIPGKHSLRGDFGYLKLRKAIQEHVIAHRGNNDSTDASIADSKPSARQASTPIICQFSSMGSLSSKWLSDFITALDVNESVEVQTKNKKPEIQLEQKIKLVWPTVEEIRNSIEGYRGGGSVPATSRNVNKDFLAPLYHRWSKDRVHGNRNTDPLGMSKTVPHIKTFLQFTPCANDRTAPSIDWLCLTSHNLSKAAWGEVQNSTGSTTKVLFIRHWELGVFISPSTLAKNVLCDDGVYKSGSVYLRPYTGSSLGGSPISIDCDDEETEEEGVTTTVPIPYDAINPTKYGNGDMPWTIDGPGKVLPDAFGLMGN